MAAECIIPDASMTAAVKVCVVQDEGACFTDRSEASCLHSVHHKPLEIFHQMFHCSDYIQAS